MFVISTSLSPFSLVTKVWSWHPCKEFRTKTCNWSAAYSVDSILDWKYQAGKGLFLLFISLGCFEDCFLCIYLFNEMFDLSLDLFIQKQFWHFVRLSSVYLFKRMSLHYTYLLKSTDFNSMYVSPNIFKVLSTTVFVFETETERLLSLVGLNLHPDLRCKKQSKYGWEKKLRLTISMLLFISTFYPLKNGWANAHPDHPAPTPLLNNINNLSPTYVADSNFVVHLFTGY